MFCGNIFMVPGQELREFSVLEPESIENERGGIIIGSYKSIGEIKAILASASTEERERYRQASHKISHKIISVGPPPFPIQQGDIFRFEKRQFYVQGIYNPGTLNHWTIYYCEERCDMS